MTQKATNQETQKPIFSQALTVILKDLNLNSTLGTVNEDGGFYHVQPDSVRNWRSGKSRPTTRNFNDLRDILSCAIDYQRYMKTFSLDMLHLSQEMKAILPSYSQQIDYYADRYYSAVEAAKAANKAKNETTEIAKELSEEEKKEAAKEAAKKAARAEKEVTEEVTEAAKEAILYFLGMAYSTKGTIECMVNAVNTAPSKKIEVTIWSPVNVWVFLNDKSHLLLYVDHNSGFDYKSNMAQVQGDFDLIFVSTGFAKKVHFCADELDSIEYDLGAILTRTEIIDSYNREEALAALSDNAPTDYSFETLAAVGTREDLEPIAKWLKQWTKRTVIDGTINYLIALACRAIGNLEIKFGDGKYINLLKEIYRTYQDKSSHGFIIEDTLEKLYSYYGN